MQLSFSSLFKFSYGSIIGIFIQLNLNANSQNFNQPPTGWGKQLSANKSFIENKGQFVLESGDRHEVLFAVDHSNVKVYFTKEGIVYKLVKPKHKSEKEKEEEKREEQEMLQKIKTIEEFKAFEAEEHRIKSINETVKMHFENANPETEVVGYGIKPDYHSYNYTQAGGTIKNVNYVKGFEKITYKNIYPSIDIEYAFAETDGLKYTVTLHPGANPSLVKMIYDKHVHLKANGDVVIDTRIGDMIDPAPLNF